MELRRDPLLQQPHTRSWSGIEPRTPVRPSIPQGERLLQWSRNVIDIQDLHKSFSSAGKRIVAVDGVSFSARDGEITGLLGPNGAGKTTTLRCLYTLMQPERGRILVDGIDVATDPLAVRRNLGVLPDARGLYKRLTARENIAYFGQLQGLDDKTIKARSDTAIAPPDMPHSPDPPPPGFSQNPPRKTPTPPPPLHT